MSDDLNLPDRFLEHAATAVVEATPSHALAAQPGLPELDNHVSVRHASALMAAAYTASRALVAAALGERAEADLADVAISYKRMGVGALSATASPDSEGWEELVARAAAGAGAILATTAVVLDSEDRIVAEASLSWTVRPAESAGA